MSTLPLFGPTPIATKEGTLNPAVDACFTCTPPYLHPREWIPNPNSERNRTLVLCFDGTGDSFDQDVSRSSDHSYLRSCLELNAISTELQRRAVPRDAQERRSYKAARLLSGDVLSSPRTIPSVLIGFCQAGIGTYTSNVLKTPIVESASKLLDEMVAWNMSEHIKGLSFSSSRPAAST